MHLHGEKCKYPYMEVKLYQYIMNNKKNGFAVSMEVLQFKDCRLPRNQDISVSKFRVIYGWMRCFMAIHDLTMCRQTTRAH
jgi:hypothetical protein